MANNVFSAKGIVLSVNGVNITGFVNAANAVEYEPNTARVTTQVGIDGSSIFNVSADKSGVMRIRLLATHKDNNYMSTLYDSLELGNQTPLVLVQLKINGGDFVIAGQALVQNVSTGSVGMEAEERTWAFVFGSVAANPGAMSNNG